MSHRPHNKGFINLVKSYGTVIIIMLLYRACTITWQRNSMGSLHVTGVLGSEPPPVLFHRTVIQTYEYFFDVRLNFTAKQTKWPEMSTYPIISPQITHSLMFIMMTSSNGNIFRITGYLCGEFTGHRWIPHTRASDEELWCFLWSAPE